MSDGHFSFASLISSRDEYEESFWPSFTDIMMVITMIFLLVTVAVVLTNTRLLDELRHSLLAEQEAQQKARQATSEARKAELEALKAAQMAEFQLKANSTLEEQLEYLQQRTATLEMDLLRSRAETEEVRRDSAERQGELTRLQSLNQQQQESLARRDQALDDLQQQVSELVNEREHIQSELAAAIAEKNRAEAELESVRDSAADKEETLARLREKVDKSEQQLLSLQGEYTELDEKYQKLLKPARSSKGKQVVEVIYRKSGYAIRSPNESSTRNVSRAALESELAGLKEKYGKELYVKVIIPSDSGLSYNEAWRFTSDMLTKYDYYSQGQ